MPPDLRRQSARYAVIGDPIGHSLSPAMQTAALRAAGIDATYEALLVPAGQLGWWIEHLRAEGYRGWNVTIPHKETVGAYLDEIVGSAAEIGAVNTMVNESGRLVGYNTDVEGFLQALAMANLDEPGHDAVVFGAGGAARAVVQALIRLQARITVVNRTPEKAWRIAQTAGAAVRALAVDDPEAIPLIREASLLVNATSLGMGQLSNASPLPERVELLPSSAVVDLVYGRPTPFLLRAQESGCLIMDGLEMLVRQGAAAFRLWTGVEPDLTAMRAACRQSLAEVVS
jgi:shikimate dehydrogenase